MKSLIFSQDLEVYGILIVQYSDHMTWRFLEIWVKETLKETPKSHFLWDFWRFGLKKLLKKLLNPTSCEISGDFG